jgi:hypothetical protein
LREASYTSLRLGLYETVKMLVGANAPGAGFLKKFLAGAIAGAIGSSAGNPLDALKTKMMADKESEGKVLSAYPMEIMKAEGIAGFYKGVNTNVVRATVLNVDRSRSNSSLDQTQIMQPRVKAAAIQSDFFITG